MRGIALADILKVSEEELLLITGTADLEAGSKILMEKGPSLVLVTLGFQAIGESLGRLMDPGSAHE